VNPQIQKWLEYCEGSLECDNADFIGLLINKWSDVDLRHIFQYFPKKEEVIANLTNVYANTRDDASVYLRPKKENAAAPDELNLLCEAFLASQRKYLLKQDIDEQTKRWLDQKKLVYVSTEYLTASIRPKNNIRSYIIERESDLLQYRQESGLRVVTSDSIEYRATSGIEEALYGLDADYYLAWFVLMPVLETEIDYKLYFDFWRKGGKYAITERELLVSSIWYKHGRLT
jgi:hypothetical protein